MANEIKVEVPRELPGAHGHASLLLFSFFIAETLMWCLEFWQPSGEHRNETYTRIKDRKCVKELMSLDGTVTLWSNPELSTLTFLYLRKQYSYNVFKALFCRFFLFLDGYNSKGIEWIQWFPVPTCHNMSMWIYLSLPWKIYQF